MKIASIEDMMRDMEHGVYDFTKDGKCSGCGNCCSNYLPLTAGEVNRIAQYVKKHGIREQLHLPAPMNLEGYDTVMDATCPFRDNANKRCVIYEIRPSICRDFRCDKPSKRDMAGNMKVYRNGVKIVFMRKTFFGQRGIT